MARVKRGVQARRHKKILISPRATQRPSRSSALPSRRSSRHSSTPTSAVQKKRNFRSLWTRIVMAARINGLSYSRFMNGLLKAGITLDRGPG